MTHPRLDPLLGERLREWLGRGGWRRVALIRRTAAGILATIALVLAVSPGASAGVPLVVAVADIASGATLRAADIAVREWPAELVPAGALREVGIAVGRVAVGAVRVGEPLTDLRLVGAEQAAGPDSAAVPVRLADAGVAALLVPGSRVDVVTVGERADQPVVLASDATVLTVLQEDAAARGRLVMVAMPRATAARVAAASLGEQVAVTLR